MHTPWAKVGCVWLLYSRRHQRKELFQRAVPALAWSAQKALPPMAIPDHGAVTILEGVLSETGVVELWLV